MMAGCATLTDKDKDALSYQINEMKASLNETNARVDELSNKFILLHEKITTSRTDIEKLQDVSFRMPEGLKVVPVSDEVEPQGAKPSAVPVKPAAVVLDGAAEPKAPVAWPIKGKDKAAAVVSRVGAPEAMYNKGQDIFIAGKYDEARKVFADFVKSFPDHNLADNALYWVGESYYSERAFDQAIASFKEVVARYPKENKAPDALLKAGYAYLEMKQPNKAKEAFLAVVKQYGETDAAVKAKKMLEMLHTTVD